MANEIKRIAVGSIASPQSGYGAFTLTLLGQTTNPINTDYLDSNLQTAINSLFGEGSVSTSSANGYVDLEFIGALGNMPIGEITWESDTNNPLKIAADGYDVQTIQQGSSDWYTPPTSLPQVDFISFGSVPDDGYWTINGSMILSYYASAWDVANAFGWQVSSVSGDMAIGFTVTWGDVNQHTTYIDTNYLLTAGASTSSSITTIQQPSYDPGGSGTGMQHVFSVQLSSNATDGYWSFSSNGTYYFGPWDAGVDLFYSQPTGWSVQYPSTYYWTLTSFENASHSITVDASNLRKEGQLEIQTITTGTTLSTCAARRMPCACRIGSRYSFRR